MSTSSMSFENLAKIRPIGVTSKNDNGDFNTDVNICLNNLHEANQHPILGVKSSNKLVIAESMDAKKMTEMKLKKYIS